MQNMRQAESNIIVHDLLLLSSKLFALLFIILSPIYSIFNFLSGGFETGYFETIKTLWKCDYEWRKDRFNS